MGDAWPLYLVFEERTENNIISNEQPWQGERDGTPTATLTTLTYLVRFTALRGSVRGVVPRRAILQAPPGPVLFRDEKTRRLSGEAVSLLPR